MKKKLLMVNGSQFGYSAGHYYYCKYLRDEFEIDYVCFDRGKTKMTLEGVNVHYLSFTGNKLKRTLRFILTAIRLSKQLKPDSLFFVYFNLVSLMALFSYRKSKKILDIRTGSLHPTAWIRKVSNQAILVQSLFFDKRVILSEGLKTLLGIPSKNTLVLPLGSDVFYNGKHSYAKLNLLYVGAFDGRHIQKTIEGLAVFLNNETNREVMGEYRIIGFGNENELRGINEAIRRNHLEQVVFFEGQKNHDALAGYFERANVGVAFIPMVDYYQNQPATKLFEYGLSGLYTIATNTKENKLFINADNGILCDDTAISFSETLERLAVVRHQINTEKVRQSLYRYRWEYLVNNELKPFLK